MDVKVITPSDPYWQRALARIRHDIYHLPDYVALSSGAKTEALAFFGEGPNGQVVWPFIKRPLPTDLGVRQRFDAASPYGYPSPVATDGLTDAVWARFFNGVSDAAKEQGLVSGFFRMHPLLDPPEPALDGVGRLVQHGETVAWYAAEKEDPSAEIQKGYAYDIRRLQRDGFVSSFDDWHLLPEFSSAYTATMERVGADASYFFGLEYFEQLREALQERLHLVTTFGPDGKLAVAGLFSVCSGIAQYLFSGSTDTYARAGATKLLLYDFFDWSLQQDIQHVHLGGGLEGKKDSLFAFKSRFAGGRRPYRTLRVIFDREVYRTLTGEEDVAGDGFFPPYRATR